MITYLIQVSIALALFYAGYALCLRQQTNFALQRGYLLFSIGASVITPFINLRAIAAMFVDVTPQPGFEATWLPEVTVNAIQKTTWEDPDWVWTTLNTLYWVGAVVSAGSLLISILRLKRIIASAKPKRDQNGWYYLLDDSPHSFSFFWYIFLGKDASDSALQTILTHERAHVRLGHSFDVMFARVVAILVWFNPIIYWFKHKLEEVHEFQADASTVHPETASNYCELLVRETLEANHISLANHFNKSLTLKRIRMIQSLKQRITWPRLTGLAVVIVILLTILSCEEKILSDINNATRQSNELTEYPEEVKEAVDKIRSLDKGSHPKVFGLVKTSDISKFIKDENQTTTYVSVPNDPKYTAYLITGYKYDFIQWNSIMVNGERVFTAVENITQPKDGMAAFFKRLTSEIKYPIEALQKKISGRVFVKFMVDENGLLSNFQLIQGIGSGCDEEAVRALKTMPNWEPSTLRGKPVKSYFHLAIAFDPEMVKEK